MNIKFLLFVTFVILLSFVPSACVPITYEMTTYRLSPIEEGQKVPFDGTLKDSIEENLESLSFGVGYLFVVADGQTAHPDARIQIGINDVQYSFRNMEIIEDSVDGTAYAEVKSVTYNHQLEHITFHVPEGQSDIYIYVRGTNSE